MLRRRGRAADFGRPLSSAPGTIEKLRENAVSYDPEAIDWMPQKAESMEQNP